MTRRTLRAARPLIFVSFLGALLLPVGATAQTVGGSIAGVVRDSTGAVLPGVTVEASSPTLIEKVRTAVTDAQGNYRIPELRPGVYTVTFTLPGFSTVRREGLELTTGFTATVNAELNVGAIEETLTVGGASPVVDIQNVRQQNVFSRDLLDTLPTNRSVAGFATLIMGATLNDARQQNVGGNQSEALSAAGFTVHGGRSDDQKLFHDGMMATDASFAGNTNRNAVNAVAVQEMVFQIGGMGAESETGGVQINVVPRDGGNRFSIYFNANGTGPAMQSENLSDELRARGLTRVPSVKKIWDIGGAVGGPIRRDKVWFFAASRNWGSQNYAPGNYFNKTHGQYIGAPNSGVSLYTPDLDRPAYTNGYLRDFINVRITWQASEKSKFNFSQNYQGHCDCFRGVDGSLSPEAVQQRLYGPTGVGQATWNYPASNRLLLEAGGTFTFYHSETGRAPGVKPTDIPILELSTGYQWGGATSASTNYARPYKKSDQFNTRFIISYITGSHSLKAGGTYQYGLQFDRTESNYLETPYGQSPVRYRFRNGLPDSIDQFTELENEQRLKANVGVFVQDQWTVNRLTLNGGLRFTYYNAYVPAQTIRAPGNRHSMFLAPEFGPNGVVFPAVHKVPEWKDVTPRLGAAYDLFGNGKTAIKASLGRYVAYVGLTQLPRANAPARSIAATARRTWNDANENFYPDCVLTNPLANGECGQISNLNLGRPVPSTTYADDVLRGNREYNWQGSVSLQQQLVSGIALNVGYFRTWYGNSTVATNRALMPADFDNFCITASVDPRLGAASGQRICGFYDVKPEKFGLVDELVTQASHFGRQTEVYDGVDIGVSGRFGRYGILQGGVSMGRTVTDSCDVVRNNPQIELSVPGGGIGGRATDDFCRLVNSNQTQVKLAGNYPLPWWGLEASATYQNLPGIPIFASLVVPNAAIVPSLGRNLSAGARSNVTVALMKPYTEFGSRMSQLDVRIGKSITIGRARVRGQFDVYNVFNAATILAQNAAYGPAWQQPQSILGGRLLKFGVQFEY